MTGVAKGTVTRFLVALGRACDEYQDAVLRDLPCKRVQADEIWTFVYSKQRNVPRRLTGAPGIGDAWTWTAICQDTKLIPTWLVGLRDKRHAALFIDDLAERIPHRIELVTDGHPAYLEAVDMAFGELVDYAQVVKQYTRAGESLFAVSGDRRGASTDQGPARLGARADERGRAGKPHDAHVHAPVHSTDQWILQEVCEP